MNTFSKVKVVLQGALVLAKLVGSVGPEDFDRLSQMDTFQGMEADEFLLSPLCTTTNGVVPPMSNG